MLINRKLTTQSPEYLALSDQDCEAEYWLDHYMQQAHWNDVPDLPTDSGEGLAIIDQLDAELEAIIRAEQALQDDDSDIVEQVVHE